MEPRDYATIASACIALAALVVNGYALSYRNRHEVRAHRLLDLAAKLTDEHLAKPTRDDAARAIRLSRTRLTVTVRGLIVLSGVWAVWSIIVLIGLIAGKVEPEDDILQGEVINVLLAVGLIGASRSDRRRQLDALERKQEIAPRARAERKPKLR